MMGPSHHVLDRALHQIGGVEERGEERFGALGPMTLVRRPGSGSGALGHRVGGQQRVVPGRGGRDRGPVQAAHAIGHLGDLSGGVKPPDLTDLATRAHGAFHHLGLGRGAQQRARGAEDRRDDHRGRLPAPGRSDHHRAAFGLGRRPLAVLVDTEVGAAAATLDRVAGVRGRRYVWFGFQAPAVDPVAVHRLDQEEGRVPREEDRHAPADLESEAHEPAHGHPVLLYCADEPFGGPAKDQHVDAPHELAAAAIVDRAVQKHGSEEPGDQRPPEGRASGFPWRLHLLIAGAEGAVVYLIRYCP